VEDEEEERGYGMIASWTSLSADHCTHASLYTLTMADRCTGLGLDLDLDLDLDLGRPSDDHHHITHITPITSTTHTSTPPNFNTNNPRRVLSLCRSGTASTKGPRCSFCCCTHALATSFWLAAFLSLEKEGLRALGYCLPSFFCFSLSFPLTSVAYSLAVLTFLFLFPFSFFFFASRSARRRYPLAGEKKNT
jgi:hypothetical protein